MKYDYIQKNRTNLNSPVMSVNNAQRWNAIDCKPGDKYNNQPETLVLVWIRSGLSFVASSEASKSVARSENLKRDNGPVRRGWLASGL